MASYYRQLSLNIKMVNYKIETSFIKPEGPKANAKLVFILCFLFYYSWKIVCDAMLYMIFQYSWEIILEIDFSSIVLFLPPWGKEHWR